ncbi:MAG: DUF1501 domain-containing protein [Planctomycetaceae bacterium]
MLMIPGAKYTLCDRVPRRRFLEIGGLSLCGLSLADLLRAEDAAPERRSQKSVIMVFLPGGPSHVDMYDLKPEAPAEIRGEFQPIATSVPGIQICEHLPRLAQMMQRLVPIRSIVGGPDDHACHMCLTGYARLGPQPSGGRPSIGSVVSRLLGPRVRSVPPSIDLANKMIHPPYNDPGPGFLGVGHAPFRPDDESRANMVLNGVSADRLSDRQLLLAGFDRLKRDADGSGMLAGVDVFHDRAFDLLTSPKLRDALDVSREDPRVLQEYGPGDPSLVVGFNAAPKMTEHLLAARRLIEAGARCVTVAFGAWDWHFTNFKGHREQMPLFDRGISALVNDLHARGLDRDVLVVVWGEFGRSPRINAQAGRDHWPAVSSALLACGGIRGGQVIGSTTRLGETAKDRPVHFRDVLATIYRHLEIDVAATTVTDLGGRPQYLLDSHEPIAELFV